MSGDRAVSKRSREMYQLAQQQHHHHHQLIEEHNYFLRDDDDNDDGRGTSFLVPADDDGYNLCLSSHRATSGISTAPTAAPTMSFNDGLIMNQLLATAAAATTNNDGHSFTGSSFSDYLHQLSAVDDRYGSALQLSRRGGGTAGPLGNVRGESLKYKDDNMMTTTTSVMAADTNTAAADAGVGLVMSAGSIPTPVTANSPLSSTSTGDAAAVEDQERPQRRMAVKGDDDDDTVATADKSKKLTSKQPGQKGEKRQREPRFAFMTKSEVDHLEDGYRWRKYGQKAVKNSPYPRSYYRCTTQKCSVKKRVERSYQDPSIVITTYEGQHTHQSPATVRGSSHILVPPPTASLAMPLIATSLHRGSYHELKRYQLMNGATDEFGTTAESMSFNPGSYLQIQSLLTSSSAPPPQAQQLHQVLLPAPSDHRYGAAFLQDIDSTLPSSSFNINPNQFP